MRLLLVGTISLLSFFALGQNKEVVRIDNLVRQIETDTTVNVTYFDLGEISENYSDGGGSLTVFQKEGSIIKIINEVFLSYGKVSVIIYLKNGIPVKIIETEENFEFNNNEINYSVLNEVFKVNIYVFDWEKDSCQIIPNGKRVLSDDFCSVFEFDSILDLVNKVLK